LIPALFRPNMTEITSKENVTYYARVSTDFDEQEESYERQKKHFEDLIKSHSEWNYVEGYADQGISGTKADKRPEFQRMIEDCRNGKINRILVKSISRFARNTVDTLSYIRELKELGVSVYFETQGIDTMTTNGEVLITILAAMAEQESRTISTNIKWSYKKRFQDGRVLISAGVLGYKKTDDGYEIVEEEAEIVRRIFREYIGGKTIRQLVDELNLEGIKTKMGKTWRPSGIQGILANEKYTGNAFLGKTYKADVLSKARVKNTGQAMMYYVENSHPAIITQETYEIAQKEKLERTGLRSSENTGKGKYSGKYPLSGLLVCGSCGSKFRRHSRKLASGKIVPIWTCISKQKSKNSLCKMLPIKEDDVINVYKKVTERLCGDLSELVEEIKQTITSEIKNDCTSDLEPIQEKLTNYRKEIMNLFKKKKSNQINSTYYETEYKRLSEVIKELEKKESELKLSNSTIMRKHEDLKRTLDALEGNANELTDPYIMRNILEYIKVIDKNTLEFEFKCDLSIKETI